MLLKPSPFNVLVAWSSCEPTTLGIFTVLAPLLTVSLALPCLTLGDVDARAFGRVDGDDVARRHQVVLLQLFGDVEARALERRRAPAASGLLTQQPVGTCNETVSVFEPSPSSRDSAKSKPGEQRAAAGSARR